MGQELTKLSPEELKARQIKEMDAELKQKLQRGANYNMKVVIKGDKNTGKTCLWRRLQRMAFLEDYHGTDQIQIATIPWDYKVTSDKIKVEVWDVVDKASRRKGSGGLKIGVEGQDGLDVDPSDDDGERASRAEPPPKAPGANAQGSFAVDKLDAETVDVYKNCHAVLFLMDPRKKWTFDYIERELPNVPKNTFVLILVNYRDAPQNQRVISEYEVQEFARNSGNFIRCIECSMKNCYGMKGIRCFFNLPFLNLKRQYIIQQLKENEADLDAADQELDLVNSEQNYEFYLKWLDENFKNRKATAQLTNVLPEGPPPRAALGKMSNTDVSADSLSEEKAKGLPQGRDRSVSASPIPTATTRPSTPTKPPAPAPAPTSNSAAAASGVGGTKATRKAKELKTAPAAQPSATPPTKQGGGLMSWTSKLFNSAPANPAPNSSKKEVQDAVADLQKLAKDPTKIASTTSVEDFVPPSDGADDFWGGDDDDDDEEDAKKAAMDSDDEDGSNLLIAQDEDLDGDTPPSVRRQVQEEDQAKQKLKREREEKEREKKREQEKKEREREKKEKEQEQERREKEKRARSRTEEPPRAEAAGGYEQLQTDKLSKQKKAATLAPTNTRKTEKSLWGTQESESDTDDDDDGDGVWGTSASKKKKKIMKGNPLILSNDDDLPSEESDNDESAKQASGSSQTSASMGALPSLTTEKGPPSNRHESGGGQERRKDKESRSRRGGSFGELPEGDSKREREEGGRSRERKSSRHRRHREDRDGDEKDSRRSRHRHKQEENGGGGERESRRKKNQSPSLVAS